MVVNLFNFLFTQDVEYYECTTVDSWQPWCATAVDPAGNVVTNMWADCHVDTCPVEGSETCLTIGGPSVNTPCVFPFTIKGETYNECVTGKIETSCMTTILWGVFTIKTCKVNNKFPC